MPNFLKETAGGVIRKEMYFYVAIRLPPTADPEKCFSLFKDKILKDPPYGAEIEIIESFNFLKYPGFNAP